MQPLEETKTKLHFSTFPICQCYGTLLWASLILMLSQQLFLHVGELFLKNAVGADHSYFSHKECRFSCSTIFFFNERSYCFHSGKSSVCLLKHIYSNVYTLIYT